MINHNNLKTDDLFMELKAYNLFLQYKNYRNSDKQYYAVVRYQNTKSTFYKMLYPEALYENDYNSKGHKFHLNYLLSI